MIVYRKNNNDVIADIFNHHFEGFEPELSITNGIENVTS